MGGLIPTVVHATVAYTYVRGEVTVVFQDSLDMIMPGLVPLSLVAITYWMLGREKLNSTRVIFILLILGVVFHAIGILA